MSDSKGVRYGISNAHYALYTEGTGQAGCEIARDEWQSGAPVKTGGYSKSIRYRVEGGSGDVQGHVYSTKPGMPHLLQLFFRPRCQYQIISQLCQIPGDLFSDSGARAGHKCVH